jgi:hypothetical protein
MLILALAYRPAVFIAVALALGLLRSTASATPLCRWVDEDGRTQISDVVPERYKNSATCSDSQKYELSPEQKRDAEQRAAEAQARKRAEADASSKAAATPPANTESAALPKAKSKKRPTEVITDDTDCPTRWRIYDESVECFGPYRTTRGATKPEAFDHCIDIPSPEVMCGPRRN